MIISNRNVQQVLRTYNRQGDTPRVKSSDNAGAAGSKDKVMLSSEGREMQSMTQAVLNAPEVRTQLVEDLRTAIQQGRYNPSPEDVAKRMLERGFGSLLK